MILSGNMEFKKEKLIFQTEGEFFVGARLVILGAHYIQARREYLSRHIYLF